jgi:hypothetical protein
MKRQNLFSQIKKNLKIVYSDNLSYLTTINSVLLIGVIMAYFTKYNLTKADMGIFFANIEVVLQILIAIFFAINIAILGYRLKYTTGVKIASTGSSSIGSLIGIITAGCPFYGASIASFLGLTSFLSLFPFYGLELKMLGLSLLVYSTITLLIKPFDRAIPISIDLSKKHIEW